VSWKVTVRHGPKVSRDKTDTLDEAIEEARSAIERVRAEGRLPTVKAFRDYEPDQRVHARVEISGPGLLRGKEGGIDLMGDGTVVPYTGAIRKRELGADSLEDAFERLREALD
jgi:predicted RNase H-like HicB family nuclease